MKAVWGCVGITVRRQGSEHSGKVRNGRTCKRLGSWVREADMMPRFVTYLTRVGQLPEKKNPK